VSEFLIRRRTERWSASRQLPPRRGAVLQRECFPASCPSSWCSRNDRAAVYVGRCATYPAGFEFEVRVVVATEGLDPSLNGPYARRGGDGRNYDEMLRFGIEFADGARATNVRHQTPGDEDPVAPYMRSMAGRGSSTSWNQGFWVWPLPPPGALAFVCEWPAADIAHTRVEIDAQVVIDAAARSTVVFPRQPKSEGGWTSSGGASFGGRWT
jgi:hypothetical protein